MTLTTNDPADIGTYAAVAAISLTDYTGVTPLSINFSVTVTCEVLTFSFGTSPTASTTVQVGITTQPVSLPFATTKTPNCV